MSIYKGTTLLACIVTPHLDTRNVGQIIQSTLPLTDAGLHLLDGSLLSDDGIYSEFVTYISQLVGSHPELFTIEADWQTSVTNYGVCGKFVYDSVNNTVRLPKLYSTERYLIDSYSSEDAWYRVYSDGWCEQGNLTQNTGGDNNNFSISLLKSYANTNYFISQQLKRDGNDGSTGSGWNYWKERYTDHFTVVAWGGGQILWSTQGYTDVSNYKVTQLYQYIVIANSTKTEIEVDIDEIVTDLNGKVDKADLDEIQCVVETYQNGSSWYRIYSDGWCEQGGYIATGETGTVTFLKAYSTLPSVFFGNITTRAASSYDQEKFPNSVTTTEFTYTNVVPSGGIGVNWMSVGYI